jgi:hypothetical protein
MSARILLSGASGLLGTALRDVLARREMRFLQLVRRSAGENTHVWNPRENLSARSLAPLEGCRAAIHLSGASIDAHRWTASYRRELIESRVASTRVLAQSLARLHRPPEALIVSSAVGIYGDRGDEILDESTQSGSGFLAELCQEWEAAAAPARKAGIRVIHLRTGVVLSARGGALVKMLPLFRRGLGGPLGSGRQWMSWIEIDDAVRAILFLLEHTELRGPVNLTAPEPVTNAEFTRALAQALHRPAFLRAPAFALRLALGEMARETLLASQRAYPARLAQARFPISCARIDEALAALFDPAHGRDSALS